MSCSLPFRNALGAYGAQKHGGQGARPLEPRADRRGWKSLMVLWWALDGITGRWINRDPMRETAGLNLYGYASQRPISYVDPLGLYDCKYQISTHTETCTPDDPSNPTFSSSHFVSGNDDESDANGNSCQNNSNCKAVPNSGPIPPGTYDIGNRTTPGGGRRNLTPEEGTDTQNRTNFQTHGCSDPATCSEGCIAATTNKTRDEFNNNMDKENHNTLHVVP